jgi:hypothetical protein
MKYPLVSPLLIDHIMDFAAFIDYYIKIKEPVSMNADTIPPF